MPVPLLFGRGSNCTTCGNNPASHQWEECNNQSLMESWDHNCQYHISDLQSNENHYRNRLRQDSTHQMRFDIQILKLQHRLYYSIVKVKVILKGSKTRYHGL